jgi:predicted Zn-ribbon and HTH transcriptional regulator
MGKGDGERRLGEIVRRQLCLRCGHTWMPNAPGRPTVCPKCKSPRWWTPPRRRKTAEEIAEETRNQE